MMEGREVKSRLGVVRPEVEGALVLVRGLGDPPQVLEGQPEPVVHRRLIIIPDRTVVRQSQEPITGIVFFFACLHEMHAPGREELLEHLHGPLLLAQEMQRRA
jgi:hypothetical protein